MFAATDHVSPASLEMFETQMALMTQFVHAVMDVAVCASEQQVDAMRALFASATVASRQWLTAGGAADWSAAVPQHVQQVLLGRLPLAAPPVGAPGASGPDAGTAPRALDAQGAQLKPMATCQYQE